MTDVDSKEPLSCVSDGSFIILEYSSPPPSINNEAAVEEFIEKNPNTFVDFESKKSQSNSATVRSGSWDSQCFSEGNVQEKLKELIGENNQLKETLSQNNLAIKSQLDTFYKWQQEVLKTHENLKEKFLETKNFILKLRAENLSLKKQLAEGSGTISDDGLQLSKNDDCDSLDNLKICEKLKSMCEELRSKNELLEMENIKLRESLKVTEKEVFKLSNELEDSLRESNFLKQKSDELNKNSTGRLGDEVLPNSEFQAQLNNLTKELEMEKRKNMQLTEKLKKASNIISVGQNLNLIQGVDEYLMSVDESYLTPEGQNQRLNTLQDWVTLEENVDKANHNQIGEVKDCHVCQKPDKQKEKNLEELEDQFSALLKDYKALQEQLTEIQNKDEDKINNLSLLLKSKKTELFLQQQEIDRLKEEIKKLSLDCEEVEILKVQMELYKNDFNNERADREKLAGEKEAMAEQLRLLRSEFEKLKKPPEEEQNIEKTDTSEHYFIPYEIRKNIYVCPQCMFSFNDAERCKNHVLSCLNPHVFDY